MIAPLIFGNGRSIALAVTLAILISVAPHEASAKGGTFHLFSSEAKAATLNSPPTKPTIETLGVGLWREAIQRPDYPSVSRPC
jgi:hypothetical protein